jgi:UDP-2-acetamido-2,6-beta-L-arabino-hexul-4-ose reductase
LSDKGDERGQSFSVPGSSLCFLGSAVDLHVTTIRPGHVRGNHYHVDRREILVVVFQGAWSLYWDHGPGTTTESRRFAGTGAVLIEVDPLASHAVLNDGNRDLHVVAMTNRAYDPGAPDTVHRPVV